MRVRFFTCDVFTEALFGGNQLAVIPEASGLTTRQMQQIAREFNYSETTFVLPPESAKTRRVRIFTPAQELPFAGHPNIGTAFVLAETGALGSLSPESTVVFEEAAGDVAVTIRCEAGRVVNCELKAPQKVALMDEVPVDAVAAAVSLPTQAFVTDFHRPLNVSVGVPFLFAELRGLEDLARAKSNNKEFEVLFRQLGDAMRASVYVYCRVDGGSRLQARLFAPLAGVPEDPATGSAACAVAGLLASLEPATDGEFVRTIDQGVEMGRPSLLATRAVKVGGEVIETYVGGSCVMVSDGHLSLPED